MHETLVISVFVVGVLELLIANVVALLWLRREYRWRKAKRLTYGVLFKAVSEAFAAAWPALLVVLNEQAESRDPQARVSPINGGARR